uniref:Uncharacterized protein n=1 Tax=Oryza glumipatula TaxID=40148 RepID=A0A0D9YUY4_9ORYZ
MWFEKKILWGCLQFRNSISRNSARQKTFGSRTFRIRLAHVIDVHLQEECKGFIEATAVEENGVYPCMLAVPPASCFFLYTPMPKGTNEHERSS